MKTLEEDGDFIPTKLLGDLKREIIEKAHPEVKKWLDKTRNTIYKDVVCSLLAGNDSQCFTVEQYRKAYAQRWLHKDPDLAQYLTDGLAEHHLKSLPNLVVQVRPGVWRAK